MIRTVKIDLHAAHPNMPIDPAQVFIGSAASFTILNVPKAVGKRQINSVSLTAKNAASVSQTYAAVRVGSAYEVTVPASHFAAAGIITNGVIVKAVGTDENGAAATWTLGTANLTIIDPASSATPEPISNAVKRTDFSDIDAPSAGDSIGQVKTLLGTVITRLKSGVTATAALVAFAAFGALGPNTIHDDISGTNTIADIVAAAGISGGGLDTNAVDALIYSYDTTNITARLDAKADALTEAQTNAVNSGITAAKVGTYDGYAAMIDGKADAVSLTNKRDKTDLSVYALETRWEVVGELNPNIVRLNDQPEYATGAWRWNGDVVSETSVVWVGFEDENANECLFCFNGMLHDEYNFTAKRNFIKKSQTNSIATISQITPLIETQAVNTAAIDGWETYWTGDRVRLSVTNYYGNTSGDLARLRVEESETNSVGTITGWRTVWDENDRATNTLALVYAATNGIVSAAKQYTDSQVISRAPRAWGSLTSAGTRAPNNMVWMTEPNTVFAGGTEYAHVSVGEGSICVLVDNGAPVYTEGETGQFRFKDDSGQYYFGFDVRSAYTIGCRTDDISVTKVSGTNMVTLVYDLVSATNPEILHCTNLLEDAWTTAEASWEQNPPTGTKVCYLNAGTNSCGFYKAQLSYAGGSKFVTNMQADLTAGIAASNETLNVIQSVEPYISNGQVLWRVKQ